VKAGQDAFDPGQKPRRTCHAATKWLLLFRARLISINAGRGEGRDACFDHLGSWTKEGIDMPHYQVSLYKDLLSSDGHPFHCLQATIEVDAEAPDRAVGLVLKDMHGDARDWSIEVNESPTPAPSSAAIGQP
jgi:hypothetical protein